MWRIIGQDKVVSFLGNSLGQDKLCHAYVFYGPSGVGKQRMALTFAQALNCQASQPPCQECLVCERILSGNHPDIIHLELLSAEDASDGKAKAEIGVKQVEDIQHAASLPPFEGKYKVFIIHHAEKLSQESSNRLLKTLEEPGSQNIFILLTADKSLLLPTVISRCQILELRYVEINLIRDALLEQGLAEEKAELLSHLSHGRIGWAMEAASNPEILEERKANLEKIILVLGQDEEERFDYASDISNLFAQNHMAAEAVLDMWLAVFRDMLLLKADASQNMTNIDYKDILYMASDKLGLADIRIAIDNILKARSQLRANANPRLCLEVLMLSLPLVKEGL
ncbi:DNA polymerase III subunit delta' [Dehalococcoides mccartyi]|uniref:DNA polymerase III subunit delta' n=1 Tax=Dehalococcoides mccartyi (strain VS) TaxID=311424 RepID=D2BH30_DEHMV|nr:DNA polymerase III subunit delta' [Dehalococcoides mccartyi]ACZ61630.1 DNA-directed DNA polymerase, delta prime subunit [Dehalococcoides mccartyi VS]